MGQHKMEKAKGEFDTLNTWEAHRIFLWEIYSTYCTLKMLEGTSKFFVGWCSEKAMANHSRTLAWKLPWTEEPGRLQSMGSRRVGHN